MDFYMVVRMDDEGMFLSEPEWFDFEREAQTARIAMDEKNKVTDHAIFRCEEVTPKPVTEGKQ